LTTLPNRAKGEVKGGKMRREEMEGREQKEGEGRNKGK